MPNLATDLARVPMLTCAFCHAAPGYHAHKGVWREHHVYHCVTPNCPARHGSGPNGPACETYGTQEEAITAWNTRAASGGLNEPFGNPEQFSVNEPSGNSGQLASLEQRARELFASMMDAAYGDTTIGHIVCAETTRGRLEASWLPLITAAMRAQPPSGAVSWSEKEQTAISEMMAAQDLSYPSLVRQAVRLYQRDWIRRRDGETCRWSGDEQREREFSGAALANQQGVDPSLARFYQVESVPALIAAMEENILKLQDRAKRNVKPWEDTFPPTLMPKHVRDQGALLNKDALALAQSWEDRAAESWGEDPAHAAMQLCCDELRDLVNGATQPAGDVGREGA